MSFDTLRAPGAVALQCLDTCFTEGSAKEATKIGGSRIYLTTCWPSGFIVPSSWRWHLSIDRGKGSLLKGVKSSRILVMVCPCFLVMVVNAAVASLVV